MVLRGAGAAGTREPSKSENAGFLLAKERELPPQQPLEALKIAGSTHIIGERI